MTLAHNLKLDVVAEGVETEDQQGLLKALDCDYGQGYYYSHPLDGRAPRAVLVAVQPSDPGITAKSCITNPRAIAIFAI